MNVTLKDIIEESGIEPTPDQRAEIERLERARIVTCARSMIGTPYVLHGTVKGAGLDCGSTLWLAATECGLITGALPTFSGDWWAHVENEKYLRSVMRFARQLGKESRLYRDSKIKPGCFLLAKAAGSRVYNHGGIVTEWPLVVHAIQPQVAEVNALTDVLWANREIAVFDLVKS